jgi:hypothetical protein
MPNSKKYICLSTRVRMLIYLPAFRFATFADDLIRIPHCHMYNVWHRRVPRSSFQALPEHIDWCVREAPLLSCTGKSRCSAARAEALRLSVKSRLPHIGYDGIEQRRRMCRLRRLAAAAPDGTRGGQPGVTVGRTRIDG